MLQQMKSFNVKLHIKYKKIHYMIISTDAEEHLTS